LNETRLIGEAETPAGPLRLWHDGEGFFLSLGDRKSTWKPSLNMVESGELAGQFPGLEEEINKAALKLKMRLLAEKPELRPPNFSPNFQTEKYNIVISEEGADEWGANEIRENLVMQLVYLPVYIKPLEREGEAKETKWPFIVYNYNGEIGLSPVVNGKVRLSSLEGGMEIRVPKEIVEPPNGLKDPKLALAGRPDPREVWREVLEFVNRHVDYESEEDAIITALWAVGTHFYQAFYAFPLLKFEGPPGCGKTQANYTIGSISFHPIFTPDLSESAFFRIRAETGATIILDEFDFEKRRDWKLDDLINNAFQRGGKVLRSEKDELGRIQVRYYNVYGPLSFSGVQPLPQMTETRTLFISMRKTLRKDLGGATYPLPSDPEPRALRERLYITRLYWGPEVLRVYNSVKAEEFGLGARVWDMARPLVALAKIFCPENLEVIIKRVKAEGEAREEDYVQRPEIKVLLALEEMDKDRYVEIKQIREKILEDPEEDPKFWTNKRIGHYLRELGFKDRKRMEKGRNFAYFIPKGRVESWIQRLGLNEEKAEHSELAKLSKLGTREGDAKLSELSEHSELRSKEERGGKEGSPISVQVSQVPKVSNVSWRICLDCFQKPDLQAKYNTGSLIVKGYVKEGNCEICGNPAAIIVSEAV